MSGYQDDLAFVHDAGFGTLAVEAADRLLEEVTRSDADDRGLIVELGSGSGITAARLMAAGFDVTGIELSPAMIALAHHHAPRATFVEASWASADIPACDAVIAVGEVFNYTFDSAATLKGIERTFARVFKALWPGGVFLFDVAGPGRIPGGGPVQGAVVGDDWAVLTSTSEDTAKGTLTRQITTARKREGRIVYHDETHKQRLIPPAKVLEMLRAAGFKARSLQGYSGERFAPGHSVFLARRP